MANETKIQNQTTNATKAKNKKPGWFRRTCAKVKETFSELKRVTWPKLPTVFATTGVVLAVTAAFLVVVTGVDSILAILLELIS